jgi:hypothetical protein
MSHNTRRTFVRAVAAATVLAVGSAACSPVQPPPGATAAPSNDVESQSLATWGGKPAAGFNLPSSDGKTVDVSKELGKRPIVLVFYRGVW